MSYQETCANLAHVTCSELAPTHVAHETVQTVEQEVVPWYRAGRLGPHEIADEQVGDLVVPLLEACTKRQRLSNTGVSRGDLDVAKGSLTANQARADFLGTKDLIPLLDLLRDSRFQLLLRHVPRRVDAARHEDVHGDIV